MRLVVCDGNRILCEALSGALEACGHVVLAAATTAEECIAAATTYQPDVCELDLRLPGADDGLRVVREIRGRCPGTAVLVLSDLADRGAWAQLRQLGVAGLLGRHRSVSQIADALPRIARGQSVFDPLPPPRETAGPAGTTLPIVLTPREAQVLHRIVAGQSTRQMAHEMNIAISTLRTYVRNLLAKLGAHSRLEAAAVASRHDLLAGVSVPRSLRRAGQGQGFLNSA
jgi:two-component system, NarL family, nitrate/nitrite response regulator NarL